MSVEGNKEVIRRLAEAVNNRNLDAIDDIMAPNYIRHDPSDLLKDAGIQEYKQAFSRILNAFPDAHWTIEELLEDGDKVIGRWTFRGTHKGYFFNLPPSSREVTYPIIAIYRIETTKNASIIP